MVNFNREIGLHCYCNILFYFYLLFHNLVSTLFDTYSNPKSLSFLLKFLLLEIPFFVAYFCNKTVKIARYSEWVHHKAAQLIEI